MTGHEVLRQLRLACITTPILILSGTDDTDEKHAAELVSTRTEDDPWEAKVLLIAGGLNEVCTREILKAMDIGLANQNKAMAMRVAGILTRANWMRDGKFADAARRGLARYRNPDNLPLGEIGAGEEPDG